jgi:hypothetical protein
MNIIFLIKKLRISECGLSDYIVKLSENLQSRGQRVLVLHSNKVIKRDQNFVFLKWSIFSVINKIKSVKKKKIFFLQFSPFLQSKSGFSIKLILILFFLRFLKIDVKIVTNFHETCNKFSWKPKYFLIYFLHLFQLYVLIFLSHKVYYTNNYFVKRFKIFKSKKCKFVEIVSNVKKNSFHKKSDKLFLTFYSSHFNEQNYKIFFKHISFFNVKNKKKIFVNILGNTNSKNYIEIKRLIVRYKLIRFSNIFNNLTHNKFSKLLFDSKITIVTRSNMIEENSGLHKASLDHHHYFFRLGNLKNEKNILSIKNQNIFNFLVKKIFSDYNKNNNFILKTKKNTTSNIFKNLNEFY